MATSIAGRTRPWRAAAALAVLLIGTGGCGTGPSGPEGVSDAALEKVADTVPDWFPANFPGPSDGVIVNIIEESFEENDIEFGRSVTWRVDKPFDDVLRDLDNTMASIGWQPIERIATEGEQDSRRLSIFLRNGAVEVIRVYTDANLKGTRVVVELPA
ncbi:MAG: hypothetical protein R2755_15085 [Acidimicrobiales bacterium]